MSVPLPQPVNTASKQNSIWRDLDQSNFRKRIDDLGVKSNDYPGLPQVHSSRDWLSQHNASDEVNHVLSMNVEERLANDVAFLIASQKGVELVSAVALEEFTGSDGLSIRLAANGGISETVIDVMRSISVLLQKCATKDIRRAVCKDQIFDKVIDLNRDRIHARLQSKHYTLPKKVKKFNGRPPLHEPLGPALERLAQQSLPKAGSVILKRNLAAICATYNRADACTRHTDEEKEVLKSVVRQSHDFCTPGGRTIEETVVLYGFKGRDVLNNKHIRQVNKLGRYWGLCEDLVEASRKYRKLFSTMRLESIPRYQISNAQVASKDGKIPCFVHAEIQLLIYYGLHPSPEVRQPRVLGVSKSACYLCNLFITRHKQFFITKTHGRLYGLWTVPDLSAYDIAQRDSIRLVLRFMDEQIRRLQKKQKKKYAGHSWPTESYVQLPTHFLTSPASSTVRSVSPDTAPSVAETAQTFDVHSEALNTEEDAVSSQGPTAVDVQLPLQRKPRSTSLPMAPSPPPACTTTIAGLDAVQASSPRPQEPRLPTEEPITYSPSNSRIESWETPTKRTITSTTPFRGKLNNVSLNFEIEKPAQGSVGINQAIDAVEPTAGVLVNVGALKKGETLSFNRKDEDDDVFLNLQTINGGITQITLHWL